MTLEEQLRDREFELVPLRVTSGVLLHIGAGIYNTPASAIKELISNAYDADATRVVISMDYPNFDRIRVVDNGIGMTADRFVKSMASIGSSLKGVIYPKRITRRFGRPIIGQLGIGLMALTQICDEAIIESQTADSDTKFVVRLDFSELRKRKDQMTELVKLDVLRSEAKDFGGLDAMRSELQQMSEQSEDYISLLTRYELAVEAETRFRDLQKEDPNEEHLGYCEIYPGLPAEKGQAGTTITLTKIDSGVRDALMDIDRSEMAMPSQFRERNIGWNLYRDEINQLTWEEICRKLQLANSGFSYEALPSYHRFLWELATMTPVRYLPTGPIEITQVLHSKVGELEAFNFSVIVDNRHLFKPILLPAGPLLRTEMRPEFDYNLETFEHEEIVDSNLLKFSGYIYWQRRQIEPSALRGIQIYIRNVGIGLYDLTLMGFSTVNPSSRAGQISGEIYVDAGLERALNVDRNSFRETDAHYISLKKYVHGLLGTATKGVGILGKSIDAYWKRKELDSEKQDSFHSDRLTSVVEKVTQGKFKVELSNDESEYAYEINDSTLTLFDKSKYWPRASSERRVYQIVLALVRTAVEAGASPKEILNLVEDFIFGNLG